MLHDSFDLADDAEALTLSVLKVIFNIVLLMGVGSLWEPLTWPFIIFISIGCVTIMFYLLKCILKLPLFVLALLWELVKLIVRLPLYLLASLWWLVKLIVRLPLYLLASLWWLVKLIVRLPLCLLTSSWFTVKKICKWWKSLANSSAAVRNANQSVKSPSAIRITAAVLLSVGLWIMEYGEMWKISLASGLLLEVITATLMTIRNSDGPERARGEGEPPMPVTVSFSNDSTASEGVNTGAPSPEIRTENNDHTSLPSHHKG